MNTETPTIVVDEIATPMKRADLPAVWEPFRAQLEKLKTTAETLTVTSSDDKAGMKLARTTRLALKDVRVEIEKRRKELGEDALRQKQKIDEAAKELKSIIEPLEERLKEQEEFAEREAAAKRAELIARRTNLILPYWNPAIPFPDFGAMEEDAFGALMFDAKAALEAKQAAEKKAVEERFAKLKAEAEERERIKIENAKLKREAEEREAAARIERAKVEAERREQERKAQAEREEAAAKLKAERDAAAAEAARLAEIARKEREALEAQAKKDRAAAEAKAAAERLGHQRQMQEAERAREIERQKEAAERKAREEAEIAKRKAAAITKPELDATKASIANTLAHAERMYEGLCDPYDGADAAREVIDLCSTALRLIAALESLQ
jgi:DNA repair exonuclease SbcCD ATPase subunit